MATAYFALFRYAGALNAEKAFIVRYGGLWLLGSAEAESETRDTVHAVVMSGPMNERDQSWLRTLYHDSGGEADHFLDRLSSSQIGEATLEEWIAWLGTCDCNWEPSRHDETVEYFPSGRYHSGISSDCFVHQTVEAASRYCAIIEQEWLGIADWYSDALETRRPPGLTLHSKSPAGA